MTPKPGIPLTEPQTELCALWGVCIRPRGHDGPHAATVEDAAHLATAQPGTEAGRRFVATVAALFIDPDDDEPIDVTDEILAIEREAQGIPLIDVELLLHRLIAEVDKALIVRNESPAGPGGSVLDAMAAWPKGANGPLAIEVYEAMAERLRRLLAATDEARTLYVEVLNVRVGAARASLASESSLPVEEGER